MWKIGWIKEAFWDLNQYTVEFRDQYDATKVRRLDTGVEEPLDIGDEVLCLYTKQTNWVIMGRILVAEKTIQDDSEKSKEQRLLEEHRRLIGQYISGENDAGVGDSGVPNYRNEDEDPLGFGDAEIRSRRSGSFVRCDSSGGILAVVSDILCMVMDTFKTGILHRCKQYLLDVIPGFRLKIRSRPQQTSPEVPATAKPSTQPEFMTIEATLASDPDKDQVDFDLEAGALRDIDDPLLGKGRAKETTPYKNIRGMRLRLGDFGFLEIDNDVAETRLSFMYGETSEELYQLRFGPKEATLSWGLEQFISLTDDGLMIKAKKIGLAGSWVMWSPKDTAKFQHNQDLTPIEWSPVCRWDDSQTVPGLRFEKSVYFGDKGEPAITESYLDTVLTPLTTALDAHVHNIITPVPGSPTSIMVPPVGKIVAPLIERPAADVFLTIKKLPPGEEDF